MSSSYTGNIGLANPASGDCNWDNDWYRNQFINDIVNGVLISTNRVISGGVISDGGGVNVNIAAGSANINGTIYSWDSTIKTAATGAPELEYNSNWLYVDDSGVVQISTTIPTGDFVPLGLSDVDQVSILRIYDLRPLQIDPSILPAINKIISGTDIVDIFIGSTKNDSDLGLWRYKTESLSWYTQTLNTSTRGKTRKFPQDYLIIAKQDQIIYYDLTDSDVPMWMVLNAGSTGIDDILGFNGVPISSMEMLNGIFAVAKNGTNPSWSTLHRISFIDETARIHGSDATTNSRRWIGSFNSGVYTIDTSIPIIIEHTINDVAMTILDSAPIDSITNIKVPTIAVFTDGGVSVIDGPAGVETVKDITWNNNTICKNGIFDNNENVIISHGDSSRDGFIHVYPIPSLDINETNGYDKNTAAEFYPTFKTVGSGVDLFLTEIESLISGTGINDLKSSNKDELFIALESRLLTLKRNTTTPSDGILNRVEDSFLSAQMHGDCKLATLADTIVETIGTDTTTEHIINGTFPANINNWINNSAAGGNIAWNAAGYMDLINTTGTANADQQITTIVDQMYSLSIDETTGVNTVDVRIGTSEGGNELVDNITVATGTTEVITFKATTTSTFICFTRGSAGTTGVDNVSIKAIQNEVENGEFSSDRDWTKGAGWIISGGVASSDGLQSADSLLTTLIIPVTVANEQYIISFEITSYTAGNVALKFDGSEIIADKAATGTYSAIATASDITGTIDIVADLDFIGSVDDIKIYELTEPDRSVNDNPLRIVGQLDKTAVATNADLVAYSGFSANDFLEQPYNSDLDFGTGDFYVIGWVKVADTSNSQAWMSKGISTRALTILATSTQVRVYLAGAAVISYDYDVPDRYTFYSAWRDGTDVYLAINGDVVASVTSSADTDVSNATLRFGFDHLSLQAAESILSLWRIGAGAPTATQIKKIYNTEKKLFQENAKCILSENNVVSLSYDEDSNTLKVGSTDNDSIHSVDTFQDLIRIDTTVLDSEPIAISHTKDSVAIAESTQVEFDKDLINLRELV